MAAKKKASTVQCDAHGKRIAAVVCGHLVNAKKKRAFVENFSDPEDLQARCGDCEQMFLKEGEMTPAFRKFTNMAVVCTACDSRIRARHAPS